jgi:hypothetical protein
MKHGGEIGRKRKEKKRRGTKKKEEEKTRKKIKKKTHPQPAPKQLYKRKKIDSDQCRFGCDAVEDSHHLFVECRRYDEWRANAAEEMGRKADQKLAERGVEEAARKRLLATAKSLFCNDPEVWPLKHSFYYLGHIPPLDPLLPHDIFESRLSRERLLHYFSAEWHLASIRLAGRIFGDYQREMAKINTPLRARGKR